jgi:hypothetical protein
MQEDGRKKKKVIVDKEHGSEVSIEPKKEGDKEENQQNPQIKPS